MTLFKYLFFYVILHCLISKSIQAGYVVPDALVEPLSPRGFRVSIPDNPDYKINIFAFHGKINEEMEGREAGTYSWDVLKPKNGRWIYTDKNTKIKAGDVLYFWTLVEIQEEDGRKLGFPKDDQMFTFTNVPSGSQPSKPTQAPPAFTPDDTLVFPEDDCTAGITLVKNKVACSNSLLFDTTFDEKSANKLKQWQREFRFADAPDHEFVIYNDDPKNIYVKDNLLHIKPSLTNDKYGPDFVNSDDEFDLGEKCTGKLNSIECKQQHQGFIIIPPVLSAQMSTKNTFYFKYGTIDIRAKLPKGDWIYPQLFLNPKVNKYGSGYASGQIRIAFLSGNKQNSHKLQGGCILGTSEGGRTFGIRSIDTKPWSDDFHVFTVRWEPNAITLLVDNQEYGRVNHLQGGFASKMDKFQLQGDMWNRGTEFAPFDQEMYITIGVGVGGHSFPDEPRKPWENNDPKGQLKFYRDLARWHSTWNENSALVVDYIRVRSL